MMDVHGIYVERFREVRREGRAEGFVVGVALMIIVWVVWNMVHG